MTTRISELLDGELESGEAAAALDALRAEGDARDAWRRYHLIGDAMRDTRVVSTGFAARVAAKLADEPTVMAPSRRPAVPGRQRQRWQYLSAAASVAAVALVGWVAFAPQESQTGLAVAPTAVQAPQTVAQVPPPSSANDYIYAHQGQSPRNSLQGVAPYVRMVSAEAVAQKR
jgi:sigma-E factor negative regulatory protein RseA